MLLFTDSRRTILLTSAVVEQQAHIHCDHLCVCVCAEMSSNLAATEDHVKRLQQENKRTSYLLTYLLMSGRGEVSCDRHSAEPSHLT